MQSTFRQSIRSLVDVHCLLVFHFPVKLNITFLQGALIPLIWTEATPPAFDCSESWLPGMTSPELEYHVIITLYTYTCIAFTNHYCILVVYRKPHNSVYVRIYTIYGWTEVPPAFDCSESWLTLEGQPGT